MLLFWQSWFKSEIILNIRYLFVRYSFLSPNDSNITKLDNPFIMGNNNVENHICKVFFTHSHAHMYAHKHTHIEKRIPPEHRKGESIFDFLLLKMYNNIWVILESILYSMHSTYAAASLSSQNSDIEKRSTAMDNKAHCRGFGNVGVTATYSAQWSL